MGNFLGMDQAVVHRWGHDHEEEHVRSSLVVNQQSSPSPSPSPSPAPADSLRIKVRMTRRQLKELVSQVDSGEDYRHDSKLGRMILQECLDGRLRASVVMNSADGLAMASSSAAYGGRRLSGIKEE